MAKDVGSLRATLGLNSAGFTGGLKRAGKQLSTFSGSVTAAGSRLLRFGGLLTGAIAGASLGILVKQSFDLGDSLAKTSDKLGIATEDLARLRHAADLTGIGTKNLDLGLQRMTRRVSEAAQGSGVASSALEELGLNAQALSQLTPDQQFNAIADAMEGVTNQSDRVRLGFKLFDSEGVGLINTMRGGSAALAEMGREADALGLSMSRADAAKLEAANDAVTRMKGAFRGVANQMAISIAPVVEWLGPRIISAVQTSVAWFKRMKDRFSSEITAIKVVIATFPLAWEVASLTAAVKVMQFADTVRNVLDNVGGFIGTHAMNAFSIFKTAFSNIGIVAQNLFEGVISGKLLTSFFEVWKGIFSNAFQVVKNMLSNVRVLFTAVFEAIRTRSLEPFSDLVFTSLTDGMQSVQKPLDDLLLDLTKGTKEAITIPFQAIPKEASEMTRNLMAALDDSKGRFADAARAAIENGKIDATVSAPDVRDGLMDAAIAGAKEAQRAKELDKFRVVHLAAPASTAKASIPGMPRSSPSTVKVEGQERTNSLLEQIKQVLAAGTPVPV